MVQEYPRNPKKNKMNQCATKQQMAAPQMENKKDKMENPSVLQKTCFHCF